MAEAGPVLADGASRTRTRVQSDDILERAVLTASITHVGPQKSTDEPKRGLSRRVIPSPERLDEHPRLVLNEALEEPHLRVELHPR